MSGLLGLGSSGSASSAISDTTNSYTDMDNALTGVQTAVLGHKRNQQAIQNLKQTIQAEGISNHSKIQATYAEILNNESDNAIRRAKQAV